jgi:hypothetical protein
MTNVADMLGERRARDLAETMRRLMCMDMNRTELSIAINEENTWLNKDQELFLGAWSLLNSSERSAWKRFVEEGKCL